ncbi:linear amide C-N hydrolase [Promethearchaeum syntrophicum]|uniref:Linear amide C-N hydrolase n=1 Tax=Promethearchaeum syntrophicum TaxID=2594042 RepID=A0A5B9D6I1_9ARCH|nr:linear amide C-N hydrolase [Candidatus Prometheoarchaeum syntrophicum]QEE14586.1 Linear amide C-N hydrolases, choloylglycine hydrolase family [Candidatus Prometheoarchaeum syntrophicum]
MSKKITIAAAIGLTGILIISGVIFIPKIFKNQNNFQEIEFTSNEIIELIESDFYFLNLTVDYGFDKYINNPEASQKLQSQVEIQYGCTCISILDPMKNSLFGRNFDWYDGGKLILVTQPENGYKSISMVDLYSLEHYSGISIDEMSSSEFWQLAFSPFDGMNEWGVAVGCLVSPGMIISDDSAKQNLGSLEFMRLALDYAKNVSEVIDLWKNYDMDYGMGPDVHYMVADAQGNSVVLEWINGEMEVIANTQPWQVVTNFRIYNATEQDQLNCWRFSEVNETLNVVGNSMNSSQLLNLLADVSQVGFTKWSNVYDLINQKVYITIDRNYNEEPYIFTL